MAQGRMLDEPTGVKGGARTGVMGGCGHGVAGWRGLYDYGVARIAVGTRVSVETVRVG
jgi:hypothetical protein